MTLQTINIGTLPNDGSGDTLRTAFDKINNNFTTLNSSINVTSVATSTTNNNVIFSTNAASFSQGTFQINSKQIVGNANSGVYSNNSQNVTLKVAKSSNTNTVDHTAYSTLVFGDAIISDYTVAIANIANTSNANIIESYIQIAIVPATGNLGTYANMSHTVQYFAS